MSFKIIAIDDFKRDAKKLLKKYPSLGNELANLENMLLENPRVGTLITKDTYKIRLAVKSKGKGKSGGLRIITYVVEVELQIEEVSEQDITVFLIAIYDKSKTVNVPKHTLKKFIKEIDKELNEEE